jgi:hypothetical protein
MLYYMDLSFTADDYSILGQHCRDSRQDLLDLQLVRSSIILLSIRPEMAAQVTTCSSSKPAYSLLIQ